MENFVWAGFEAALMGIVVSEILGRGKVLYARLGILLLVTHASLVGIWFYSLKNGALPLPLDSMYSAYLACLVIHLISILAGLIAWFGIRTHLSNSITLNLLSTLAKQKTMNRNALVTQYNVEERICRRVEALQLAGYLDTSTSASTIYNQKSKWILKLLNHIRQNKVGTIT